MFVVVEIKDVERSSWEALQNNLKEFANINNFIFAFHSYPNQTFTLSMYFHERSRKSENTMFHMRLSIRAGWKHKKLKNNLNFHLNHTNKDIIEKDFY